MPSFDVVSKVDAQRLDNAINSARKEIITRYDFHDSKTTVELDKKAMSLQVVTENDMRMKHIEDIIITRLVKQALDPSCLDFGKEQYASGNMIRKDIAIKQGVDKEAAKKMIRAIKDSKLKIQGSVMDDQVRVTGKKIDDLQEMMSQLRQGDWGVPVQFENFR